MVWFWLSDSQVCLRRRSPLRAASSLPCSAQTLHRRRLLHRLHVTRKSEAPTWWAYSKRVPFCGARASGLVASTDLRRAQAGTVGQAAGSVPPASRTFRGSGSGLGILCATALGGKSVADPGPGRAAALDLSDAPRSAGHPDSVFASRRFAVQRRSVCAIPAVRRRRELSNGALPPPAAGVAPRQLGSKAFGVRG